MNILEAREGEAIVFALSGEFDSRGAKALDVEIHRCLAAGERRFVIDLTSVLTASAEGLRVLMALAQTLASTGGVALCGVGERVEEMLRVSGLRERFVIAPSRAAAARKIPTRKGGRSKTTALLARLLGAPASDPPRRRATGPSAVTRAVRVALTRPGSPGA